MTKKRSTTLASAPTLEALGECVARFYGGEPKTFVPCGDGKWAITSPTSGRTLSGVGVVLRRGRYIFEMESEKTP
jgi:hypothetical protein